MVEASCGVFVCIADDDVASVFWRCFEKLAPACFSSTHGAPRMFPMALDARNVCECNGGGKHFSAEVSVERREKDILTAFLKDEYCANEFFRYELRFVNGDSIHRGIREVQELFDGRKHFCWEWFDLATSADVGIPSDITPWTKDLELLLAVFLSIDQVSEHCPGFVPKHWTVPDLGASGDLRVTSPFFGVGFEMSIVHVVSPVTPASLNDVEEMFTCGGG